MARDDKIELLKGLYHGTKKLDDLVRLVPVSFGILNQTKANADQYQDVETGKLHSEQQIESMQNTVLHNTLYIVVMACEFLLAESEEEIDNAPWNPKFQNTQIKPDLSL